MRRKQKVLQQLMDLGLSKPFAFSAYALFGNEAVKEVQHNPYGLIRFESRKEWKEIDQLAAKLGFEEHSAERLAGAFRYSLGLATNEGHVFLPQNELFQRVSRLIQLEDENAYHDTLDTLLEHTSLNTPIREMDEARPIYLDRLYQAETGVARSLVQLYISASRMALQRPKKKALDGVETDLGIQLAPAQREAIASSLDNKIVIITGGPGTGKTTIIKGVLDLWGKKKGKILLAAPTGRAAKRLCESTGKPAKTIHRLLEYRLDTHTFNRNADNKLHADLLVVDEASMIDIELMASLLEALPDYCHLLFVGDVDQLPAVGPGYVLHDLIESQRFKTIHLTEIYRQDKGSLIPLNAKKINQGEIPETQGLGVDEGQDFYFIERITPEKVREAMLEMILHRIPNQFGFQPKTHIQVLCPMYKSEVGVDRMNEVLQQELNPSPHRFNAPFYTVAI
ncbi:AAA family ATPase, partial [bacterium]|nr:AAA family ATPase [bacterium]